MQAVLILGPVNPHAAEVREAAKGSQAMTIIGATGEMAAEMAKADLAIGTCGGAAWERCVLGLPSLVVISAENQRDDARILHSLGAVRNLGNADVMSVERWAREIEGLRSDPAAASANVRRPPWPL